jgi:hypothetical protein
MLRLTKARSETEPGRRTAGLAPDAELPLHFAANERTHFQPPGDFAQGLQPAQFHDGHARAAPKCGVSEGLPSLMI